jgi:RimJ/RimL family protein N-acetyltransferase
MIASEARIGAVRRLEREPLRNIVLLKHLAAFPDSTSVHCVTDNAGTASLVLLDAAASVYDRQTYPDAAWAALISSDHPTLTARLLDVVPKDVGVVFKLATDADRDAVAAQFTIEPAACYLSYSSRLRFGRDSRVRVTRDVDDAVFRMFEEQGHARTWLGPLLASGSAFACVVDVNGAPGSVCFAFENYGRVWEVGGVFTPSSLRGRGLAGMAVRTALAVLGERDLTPRYQVSADNGASIALAEGIGLECFLTLTHYLHQRSDTAPGAAPYRA